MKQIFSGLTIRFLRLLGSLALVFLIAIPVIGFPVSNVVAAWPNIDPFSKTSPADGAIDQPSNLTLLWQRSGNADNYRVCLSTSESSLGDCTYNAGNNNGITINNLTPNTTYYWQVLAWNAYGQMWANYYNGSADAWSFTIDAYIAPVANAGQDQSVNTLALVTLDSSSSSDPDDDTPLTFYWSQSGGPIVEISDANSANPTFTAPSDPAVITFSLIVADNLGTISEPDEVVITVNNQAPIANAGQDFTYEIGSLVTLGGIGSSDPDGDLPLSYQWTQNGGPVINLSSHSSVSPTFTAPTTPTVLTFSLVVTDMLGSTSLQDEVMIIITNKPSANAGSDQSVNTLSSVSLSGNGSDPDGDLPLTYLWTQTGGAAITLSSPNIVDPTFIAPSDPGELIFSLVVTDSLGLPSDPDSVTITVNNQKPLANAGSDKSTLTTTQVKLTGSLSSDPDGDLPLSYLWTQTGGPSVTLYGSQVQSPFFTSPGDPTVLTFSLVVTDNLGMVSEPDEVVIIVNNQVPVANAGPDQVVSTLDSIILDGNGNDPDGDLPVTFQWTQTRGISVALNDATTLQPTFTAPNDPTSLAFSLVVTDNLGMVSEPDEVVITVNNQAPVANAGPDQIVSTLDSITLDGNGNDPDGDLPLTYLWTQISGAAVSLSSETSDKPSFLTPSDPGTLVFSLIVTDSFWSASEPDEVIVDVKLPPDTFILTHPNNSVNNSSASFTFSSPDTTTTFQCSLNSGTYSPCSSPKYLTGLTEGSHTFYVRAVDGVGIIDATPASFTWVVDLTAPDTTILTHPANPSNRPSPSFTFSSPDGMAGFECAVDNGSYASCTSPKNLSGLSEGLHTFNVRAVDAAGNMDATPASYTWVQDYTSPNTVIDAYPSNPTNSSSGSFTFSSPDGTAVFQCALDSGAYAACASPKELTGLTEGSHTFYVRAVDPAGNIDGTPATFTWFIDLTPPVAPVLSLPNDSAIFTINQLDFSWNSVAGGDHYRIQISITPSFDSSIIDVELSDEILAYSSAPLDDGNYFWHVAAYDAVGNMSQWSISRTFTIDTTPPLAPTLISPAAGVTVRGTPTYSWNASVTATVYIFEYDNNSDFSSPIHTSGLLASTSKKPPLQAVGTFYWHVKAKDAAGNWSNWSSKRKVTIKPVIPVAPQLVSPLLNATVQDPTPTLMWKSVPYGNKYQIQIISGDLKTIEQDKVLNPGVLNFTASLLKDGKHYWRVRAINVLNENGAWSSARAIIIDTIAPAAPVLISPANGEGVLHTPTYSWKAVIGGKYYQFSYSKSPTFTNVLYTSGKLTSLNITPPTQQPGTYYWRVRAQDAAGNWSNWSVIWKVIIY